MVEPDPRTPFNRLTVTTVLLAVFTLVTACFDSSFAQGLPCEDDTPCGSLVCIDGLCGGMGHEPVCGNGLVEDGEECDDSNLEDDDLCDSRCLIAPLRAADLELVLEPVKVFGFTWEPSNADSYELYERLGPGQAFERLGDALTTTSSRLTVPLHRRVHADYKLVSCDDEGACAESQFVAPPPGMTAAVGHLKAPNTAPDDQFGFSVAMSADGETLVIGAPYEDSESIDDPTNNEALDSGAVYVLSLGPEGWSHQAYLKASTIGVQDHFGASVAISADGRTIAVGAAQEGSNGANTSIHDSGAVYLFTRDEGDWSAPAFLKAPDPGVGDMFGHSVALAAGGAVLVVGVPEEDSASGAVYVFERVGDEWSTTPKVLESSNPKTLDRFGYSVTLADDGATLAVGAPQAGQGPGFVEIHGREGDDWSLRERFDGAAGDAHFGHDLALSPSGVTLAVGAPHEDVGGTAEAGAVHLFELEFGSWAARGTIEAPNRGAGDLFGFVVALSANAEVLAVGAPQEDGGAAGVRDGAASDDDAPEAGASYVFVRQAEAQGWSLEAYLKAPAPVSDDMFGYDLAISGAGQTLSVASPTENRAATDTGAPIDAAAFNSGAAYLY